MIQAVTGRKKKPPDDPAAFLRKRPLFEKSGTKNFF
jgi:hypothetical protein